MCLIITSVQNSRSLHNKINDIKNRKREQSRYYFFKMRSYSDATVCTVQSYTCALQSQLAGWCTQPCPGASFAPFGFF